MKMFLTDMYLSGSIGKLVNEREDILIMYLEKLQNWPQLNKLYKQLLKERQVTREKLSLFIECNA